MVAAAKTLRGLPPPQHRVLPEHILAKAPSLEVGAGAYVRGVSQSGSLDTRPDGGPHRPHQQGRSITRH